MDENTNDICFFPTLPLRSSGTPRNFVFLIYDGHTRQRKISDNFTRLPPHTRERNDVFRSPILTDGDVCPCRRRSWLNGLICRLHGTFRQICLSPRRPPGIDSEGKNKSNTSNNGHPFHGLVIIRFRWRFRSLFERCKRDSQPIKLR